jgi:hypothetical protein
MTFEPSKHLRQVQGGAEYLEVKWRLVWLHDKYPDGCDITTELIKDDGKTVLFKASATINGHTYVGHGTAPYGQRFAPHETAETSAIGRALAHAGLGTQFTEYEEPLLADSPIERAPTPQQTVQRQQQDYPGETHYSHPEGVTEAQRKAIYAITRTLEWNKDDARDMLVQRYQKTSSVELSKAEARDCIDFLKGLEAQHRAQVEQGTLT